MLVSIYFISSNYNIIKNKEEIKENKICDYYDGLLKAQEIINKAKYMQTKLDIVCPNPKYLPSYANDTDACMDLKVVIEPTTKEENIEEVTNNSEKCFFIRPQETAVFSTGIKVAVPKGYVMLILPRSSTGFKLHCMLSNTTGVIDAGYRDEVKLALTNYGKETVCIKDAQRVAQLFIIPRPNIILNQVEDDENFREGDRKGGIGSTGE